MWREEPWQRKAPRQEVIQLDWVASMRAAPAVRARRVARTAAQVEGLKTERKAVALTPPLSFFSVF